jgi:hypothetical protein
MNRAERIAKKIRARARRKQTKKYVRPKREDFRQSILERILDSEAEAAME